MTWSLPTYSECSTSYTNLSYSFNDAGGSPLAWITLDSDPTQFKATLSKAEYLPLLEQTITVTILVTDQSDPDRSNADATIDIEFNR